MTADELRAKFTTAYKIIQRERQWRLRVFANDPVALKQKVGEMDRLLDIVTDFKNALKEHTVNEHEQLALLDVPSRQRYD